MTRPRDREESSPADRTAALVGWLVAMVVFAGCLARLYAMDSSLFRHDRGFALATCGVFAALATIQAFALRRAASAARLPSAWVFVCAALVPMVAEGEFVATVAKMLTFAPGTDTAARPLYFASNLSDAARYRYLGWAGYSALLFGLASALPWVARSAADRKVGSVAAGCFALGAASLSLACSGIVAGYTADRQMALLASIQGMLDSWATAAFLRRAPLFVWLPRVRTLVFVVGFAAAGAALLWGSRRRAFPRSRAVLVLMLAALPAGVAAVATRVVEASMLPWLPGARTVPAGIELLEGTRQGLVSAAESRAVLTAGALRLPDGRRVATDDAVALAEAVARAPWVLHYEVDDIALMDVHDTDPEVEESDVNEDATWYPLPEPLRTRAYPRAEFLLERRARRTDLNALLRAATGTNLSTVCLLTEGRPEQVRNRLDAFRSAELVWVFTFPSFASVCFSLPRAIPPALQSAELPRRTLRGNRVEAFGKPARANGRVVVVSFDEAGDVATLYRTLAAFDEMTRFAYRP